MKTLIIRHTRENRKKCTLTPLEGREEFQFVSYPFKEPPLLAGYTLLTLGAPPLTLDDQRPLCLIDGTWRLASLIERQLPSADVIKRSLPSGFKTAYPRKQTDCPDPSEGLASIEALFIAFQTLGWETKGLLDHYYWALPFLEINGFPKNNLSV